MRKRWAGLATTFAIVTSCLAVNGAVQFAKADSSGQTWTLYAAGDIARADSGADEQIAAIIKAGIAADPDHTRVAMLGDGAYPDGSLQTYGDVYDKTNTGGDGWGQFKDKTFPTPGNHDYGQQMGPSDAGYRQYWDPFLQTVDKSNGGDGDVLSDHSGWYSVDLGNWHIISLNWACSPNPGAGSGSGCSATDPQGQWLTGDLQKATAAHQHIIAMWHGARFFSQNDNEGVGSPVGPSSDAAKTNAYWKMLQAAGADIVLTGHQHNYEVFDHMSVVEPAGAPATDHQGTIDPAGPREFVVGTGGGIPSHFTSAAKATGSVKQIDGQYGVLKLTLSDNSYSWQFISAADGSVLDSGTDTTHGTAPGTTGTTVTTGPSGPSGPGGPGGPPPAPGVRSGYWMLGSDGAVYGFGTAQNFGNAGLLPGAQAVHLEPTPSGDGYWIVDDTGGVSSYGDAVYHGGPDSLTLRPGEKVTSLSSTVSGQGYWMFTSLGRVLPYGDAVSYGDMSKTRLNAPVLGSIPTPSGKGYYMVAADGGIFSFGDATFYGSMGDKKLNAPVESLVPTTDGLGYWLVASDGGIFAFGDAGFKGSMGGTKLNKPITGMVRYADGYLMVGQDGGIFNFSSSDFLGSLGANPPSHPIVSVASLG